MTGQGAYGKHKTPLNKQILKMHCNSDSLT